jgi:hypothetical protein
LGAALAKLMAEVKIWGHIIAKVSLPYTGTHKVSFPANKSDKTADKIK